MYTLAGKHRRFRSGSNLASDPLEGYDPMIQARRFARLIHAVRHEARSKRAAGEATSILTRPAYFERQENPRTTQSLFGRVMSRCLGLFGKKAA
ncbi:MAG TPA: hypothetical protein VN776_16400 [Terracidiphilus sp.]|nr:hypothetical protein [Terracidiphilus sp.]